MDLEKLFGFGVSFLASDIPNYMMPQFYNKWS